jgi:hypothetical protein
LLSREEQKVLEAGMDGGERIQEEKVVLVVGEKLGLRMPHLARGCPTQKVTGFALAVAEPWLVSIRFT